MLAENGELSQGFSSVQQSPVALTTTIANAAHPALPSMPEVPNPWFFPWNYHCRKNLVSLLQPQALHHPECNLYSCNEVHRIVALKLARQRQNADAT
jgi:hypothetical protein